ncbi:hypothetical protein [Streptomyces griseiscabiei]|uniref:Uncharacterized protein n=1 Tax=Streptomyces griseiscabiei TaxID=2993540 RepID=A0ABU4LC25_9ACTN|nr:hypothetical protein [Streptomyces griseiscabiei]MBZ3900181.1 hypothetical protein [Streptomyces griseiscabiei]MDX2913188.1 hypothetical protein [Streptomyces griseiscabiei]
MSRTDDLLTADASHRLLVPDTMATRKSAARGADPQRTSATPSPSRATGES